MSCKLSCIHFLRQKQARGGGERELRLAAHSVGAVVGGGMAPGTEHIGRFGFWFWFLVFFWSVCFLGFSKP